MATDKDISARLARLETEMAALKERMKSPIPHVSNELLASSKRFVKNPDINSAQNFLSELDKANVLGRKVQLGWWTITVTVVTFLSDDH